MFWSLDFPLAAESCHKGHSSLLPQKSVRKDSGGGDNGDDGGGDGKDGGGNGDNGGRDADVDGSSSIGFASDKFLLLKGSPVVVPRMEKTKNTYVQLSIFTNH